jgi:uncharacterized membrane protein
MTRVRERDTSVSGPEQISHPEGQDVLAGGAQRPPQPDAAAWWDEHIYGVDGIGPRRQAFNRAIVGAVSGADIWFRKHWLAVVNTALGVFIGLAVAAPILRTFGLIGPSRTILLSYHLLCAQTPSHSLYIDGHQVCLCERCLAIYSSLLLGGLILAVLRNRGRPLPPLRWQWWVIAMLPMALDGGTQLFGFRESDLFLRLLTGAIFGLATAWFALPQIEEASNPPQAPAMAVEWTRPAH